MAQGKVAIHLDQPRVLMFRHKDLRDVSVATGKPIGELFADAFAYWADLLQYALRTQDPRITRDKASSFIDIWVDQPDPVTKKERTLDELGDLLLEALTASGFVKIEKFKAAEPKLSDPEAPAVPNETAALETLG